MATVTSGFIPVEFSGNGVQLHLFASGAFSKPVTAEYTVFALGPGGTKEAVARDTFTVPADGVVHRAVGDDGTTLEMLVPPGAFARA